MLMAKSDRVRERREKSVLYRSETCRHMSMGESRFRIRRRRRRRRGEYIEEERKNQRELVKRDRDGV